MSPSVAPQRGQAVWALDGSNSNSQTRLVSKFTTNSWSELVPFYSLGFPYGIPRPLMLARRRHPVPPSSSQSERGRDELSNLDRIAVHLLRRMRSKKRIVTHINFEVVYHDLRNCLANLCQTFRDCWDQVGDCPRPKKKFKILKLRFFLLWFFFLSSCTRTLSDLCTRDSLGFEDCRFATHLLNLLGKFSFSEKFTRKFH